MASHSIIGMGHFKYKFELMALDLLQKTGPKEHQTKGRKFQKFIYYIEHMRVGFRKEISQFAMRT